MEKELNKFFTIETEYGFKLDWLSVICLSSVLSVKSIVEVCADPFLIGSGVSI